MYNIPHMHTQVTKIDRDVSSGTALQEISFWLTLERALLNIQEMREKLEVGGRCDVVWCNGGGIGGKIKRNGKLHDVVL